MIHQPILLVHGFSGAPTDWTGDKDRFFDYLVEQGFDPDLIRVFDYGYEEREGERVYNNMGDVREIAQRLSDTQGESALNCSIDKLSQDSVARGGPSKVTVIAHSLGGLVTRYYLSCRNEDDHGTVYRGNVARVITLGTPHHGVEYLHSLDPFPSTAFLFRLMSRMRFLLPPDYLDYVDNLRTHVKKMNPITATGDKTRSPQRLVQEMPAFLQMKPNSILLRQINRAGAMPKDIEFYTIFGDIHTHVHFGAFNRKFYNHSASLGDLIIPAQSASTIPNVNVHGHPIVERHILYLEVGGYSHLEAGLMDSNPNITPTHTNLRRHPEARQKIVEILHSAQS